MYSPPHEQSCGSKLVGSSGASKPNGATICGRALGNAPNIGDFDTAGDDAPIDIEGTVNLFPSNSQTTTIDINETAIIAVQFHLKGLSHPFFNML